MIKHFRQTRVGQNLVEFALIGPLFFLLVFGILEGGRMIWTYHTVSNATKEGARYTTVRGNGSTLSDAPASAGAIENHMVDLSAGLDPEALHVTMVLLDGDMEDRSRFRIETSYEYEFIVTSIFGMNGITFDTTSTDQFWREPDD